MEAGAESGPAAAPLRARVLAAGADFVVVTAIGLAVDEALCQRSFKIPPPAVIENSPTPV